VPIRPRLDAQPLARGREADEHRGCLATTRRADKKPVLPANGYSLHLALGHVIIDGQETGLGISHQCGPVVQRIPQRFCYRALGQHLRPLRLQPLVELLQDRHRQVLAHLQTLSVADVLGLPLPLIELAVIGQRLVRPQRVAAARLVGLAPRVGVAGHRVVGVQRP
jgi:hypothetical protein